MTDKKIPGRPFKKGKGAERDPRINTAGAPKKEDSWSQSLRVVGDLDGPSVATWGTKTAAEFGKLPAGLTLKVMVCLNAYASLFRDFSPGVWSQIMDRCDGKIGDDLEDRIAALEKAMEGKNEQANKG